MAPPKTLNATNLVSLGAPRLAELLIEISTGNAAAKRHLRLALAGSAGSAEAAREIAKRLASIARAKTVIDYPKIKPLAADLDSQRTAILTLVAPTAPREAFDLLWQFIDCAQSVLGRSDDGTGRLAAIFRDAVADLAPLAQSAKLPADDLARRAFNALRHDQYGAWETLIPTLAPQLGAKGLAQLKQLTESWQSEPAPVLPENERRVVAWGSSSGKIYADDLETRRRRRKATFILKQVADSLGDIESYIAQIDPSARKMPAIAAGIAQRLLQAGRPQEAWDALEAVDPDHRNRNALEWDEARTATLEALGRASEAQTFRWQRFLETLNPDHLRAHLRKLPDFEDFDAEQTALSHALTHPNFHQALHFLITWPDLARANQLIQTRTSELNGDLYELLTPAADALDAKHPLSATILRRAMIDFTLHHARATRYKHAARHLHACANLAPRITDFGTTQDHAAYEKSLHTTHARKTAFWQELEALR
jgi:hypothetical protein